MKKLSVIITVVAVAFFSQVNAQSEDLAFVAENDLLTEIPENLGTYSPIEIADVPEEVATAVATDFEEATIVEAYVDEESNYKLVLTMGEDSKTVYANAAGEWIEPNE